MELDIGFFALAIPAVIFAGLSKGGFGSGAAFASTPILALILEPGQAIGLMLPLLMAMDVAALRPYWKKWDAPSARRIVLGAVPGVALGALVYRVANADLMRAMIGAVALLFVIYQIAKSRGWLPQRDRPFAPWVGIFAGGVAGLTSFISHAGGPPVAMYMLAQNVGKTTYQATTVISFWFVNIFKFAPYAFLGIFTLDTFTADLILAPFGIFGVWLGVKAHHRLSDHVFFSATYVLLTITGAKLIYDGMF